jgi:hypothetical protein
MCNLLKNIHYQTNPSIHLGYSFGISPPKNIGNEKMQNNLPENLIPQTNLLYNCTKKGTIVSVLRTFHY